MMQSLKPYLRALTYRMDDDPPPPPPQPPPPPPDPVKKPGQDDQGENQQPGKQEVA